MAKDAATILDEARGLLLRYGIKSLSMDDVAKGLRVSKKTLYQHVRNKDDLVTKVMQLECEHHERKVRTVQAKGHNAIRESFELGCFFMGILQELDPSIHYDLEKYYPEAWEIVLDFQNRRIVDRVRDNLERGILEGFYRKDMEPEVIARIYTYRIDAVFHGGLFPQERFSFASVYIEMFFYHMLGICNEDGRQVLYQEWDQGRLNPEEAN